MTFLLLLFNTVLFAQEKQLPTIKAPFIEPDSLQSVVGEGKWMYVWPHNYIPEKIEKFNLIEYPKARKKENWANSVIFESENNVKLEVRCNEDYSGKQINWAEVSTINVRYAPLPFHKLKAGIGKPYAPKELSETPIIFVAFRIKDTVFVIKSIHEKDITIARQDALLLAEKIYNYNIQ